MALKVYTRDTNRAVRLESHISRRSVDVGLIFKAPDAEKRDEGSVECVWDE